MVAARADVGERWGDSELVGDHRVVFTPSGLNGTVRHGTTVLEAARQLGADLDTLTALFETIGVSVVVSKETDCGLTQLTTTLAVEGALTAALDTLEGERPFFIRKLAL